LPENENTFNLLNNDEGKDDNNINKYRSNIYHICSKIIKLLIK
jgi:hypothetical protein